MATMDCVAMAEAIAAGQATLGISPPITSPAWMVKLSQWVKSQPPMYRPAASISGARMLSLTYHQKAMQQSGGPIITYQPKAMMPASGPVNTYQPKAMSAGASMLKSVYTPKVIGAARLPTRPF